MTADSSGQRKTFQYNSRALALLGIRTAVVIASVLSLTDAFALVPSANRIEDWIFALLGCWITALVIWFVFFVGFLHAVRLVFGGVTVDEQGLRLWRYGKKISWSSVKAVALEYQPVFTRVFSFESRIRRLTVFAPLGMKLASTRFKNMIIPHHIPSFFFEPEQFDELSHLVLAKSTAKTPTKTPEIIPKKSISPVPDQICFSSESYEALRKSYAFMRVQRILISILIALGVTVFLGRKATVNYSYNAGKKAFRLKDYQLAENYFRRSLAFEPTFAPAWHGLASSEFSRGDFMDARRHWEKALFWKPDYVEVKVSLAYLSIEQRDFSQAASLLDSALALAPDDASALINRADLNLRTGRLREALQDARLVLIRPEIAGTREIYMAKLLIAHVRILEGRLDEAGELLGQLSTKSDELINGENLTYRLVLGSRLHAAHGDKDEALELARAACQRARTAEPLLSLIDAHLLRGELSEARAALDDLLRRMPGNPWCYVKYAQIELAEKSSRNNTRKARALLDKALDCRPADAQSLLAAAELYHELGELDKARNALKRSTAIEPGYWRNAKLKQSLDAHFSH